MFRLLSRWFAALMNGKTSLPGLALFCIDIGSALLVSKSSYISPLAIVILCDLIIIFSYGAWLDANGHHKTSPINAIAPLVIRIVLMITLAVMYHEKYQNILVNSCVWYLAIITAVYHTFYAILKTMNFRDDSWLIGTNGHIGIPNWISITRIAFSLLVPHIYAAQPFGKESSLIATIILAGAMLTDAVDGFFARKLKAFTRAGKALDPLGDKIIFYPVVVAFLVATSGTVFQEDNLHRVIFYVSLGIMAFRDVAFIVWFALYHHMFRDGTAAGLIDKIRMVMMCVFLGLLALSLSFPTLREQLAIFNLGSIILVAALSILSIVIDYKRVMPTVKEVELVERSSDE